MNSILNDLTVHILLFTVLFEIMRFENQRWVRARSRGVRGSNEIVGLFVDSVAIFSAIIWYLFLIAYGFDTSFITVIFLYFIVLTVSTIHSSIVMDEIFIWIISTVLILPIGVYLILQTTLFGLLN